MKKLILIFSFILVMSGCSATEKGVLTCNGQSSANGLTSTVTMRLEHEDGLLIKQVGDTTLKADTLDGYQQILAQVEQITSIYKTIEGTSYTYAQHEDDLTIDTHSEINVNDVDKAQLSMVINYGDGEALHIDNIKEALVNQGYACSSK